MAKVKAVLLPERAIERAKLIEIDDHDLKDAQRLVGGWVECVTTHLRFVENVKGGIKLLVDEEGVLKGKAVNVRASTFYGGPRIVGDAIVVGWDHSDPEYPMRDISDAWIEHIREAEELTEQAIKNTGLQRVGSIF